MDDGAGEAMGEYGGAMLRGLFPGYFPPSADELKIFLVEGMVVFDTNALFAAYRLHGQAREQFLATLKQLGDRLWIPYQVGWEFLKNRTTVIKECASYSGDLRKHADATVAVVRDHGKRRGFSDVEITRLEDLANVAVTDLITAFSEIYNFDVELHADPDDDPIFLAIEEIIAGKVGPALTDLDAAEREGMRRVKEQVPPGYKDADKPGKDAAGDYLLWVQTITEAKRRQVPVLLVGNDEKSDWVRMEQDRKKGPRPELVAEMMQKTGQRFHRVNVGSFLVHAGRHLLAEVSDSTVEQAEQVQASASSAFATSLSANTVGVWGTQAPGVAGLGGLNGLTGLQPLISDLARVNLGLFPELSNWAGIKLASKPLWLELKPTILGGSLWGPSGSGFDVSASDPGERGEVADEQDDS